MQRNEFLKQVAEDRMLPVYLWLGEEGFWRRELLRVVLDHYLTAEEQQFNYMRLSAAAVDLEQLQGNLETGPFFGKTRVLYIEELEQAVPGLEETILQALNGLADGLCLLLAATKLDGRKKVHQQLQARINVVDCNRLTAAELPVWIRERSTRLGLRLTPAQIRLVGERLGSDLWRIDTELEKLLTFSGPAKQISDIDLESLVPGEPEPDIFGLIDAVAGRDPRLGLPRLEELLNSGENEVKILATLARQFRNIIAALEARRQGLSHQKLAQLLKINPYVAEKSFRQSGQFSLAQLQQILERLLQADYRIKTGQQEPRLELELTVAAICGLSASHSFAATDPAVI